jgi:molybdate transport system regulatory protein
MARLTLRIDLADAGSIGPGKVRLLELVAELGSIRSAGKDLRMSYARAWKLVQDLNVTFGSPVLTATAGGKSGGGARLTPLGVEIVSAYRAAEQKAAKAAQKEMATLMHAIKQNRAKRPQGTQAAAGSE